MFSHLFNSSKNFISQTACALILAATVICPAQTIFAAENEQNTYSFDEIVVTATRTEKPLKEVSSSISVITREMIDKSPETTLTGILSKLPGLQITNTFGGGYGNVGAVTIRQLNGGGYSSKLLVLLDGRPILRAYGGGTDFNLIPLDAIDRIEVVRGPVSAMYGDTALSGAINIITRKPEKNAWSISTRAGSYGTFSSTLVQEGSDGKNGYLLTAQSGKSAGFRANSDGAGQQYTLRVDYGDDLIFRLGYATNRYDNPAAVNTPAPANPTQAKRWTTNWNEASNDYIDIERKFSSANTSTSIRGYINNDKQRQVFFASTGPNLNLWMKDTLKGIQLQQDIKTSAKETVTWGGDYRWLSATNLLTNTELRGGKTYSVFVQDDRKLGDRIDLNVGGRYDHHSAYGGQFSPKIGLVYMARPDMAIKLNAAHAFKAPTLSDLYGSIGNPNLKPSEVYDYEFGIDKQFNANTRASLVYYRMVCINDIVKGPSNMVASNIDVKPQGVEMEFTQKINDHIDFWTNYTYVDAGQQTFYLSRHKANFGINYQNGLFNYSLAQKYVGSTWTDDASSTRRHILSPYQVTDLKISYNPNPDYTITFGVENMFNRQYQVLEYYPAPGRTYTIVFTRRG